MTKYVLNSGGIRNNPGKAKEFFAEIVKGLGPKPKMLITQFSQPRENWELKFAEYESSMNDSMPDGVEAQFELAFPDQFEEQVKRSDIIYMNGGDDHLIRYWLEQYDLPKLWEGKVVAGSSAGSGVLVAHYWTCDWRKLGDGLGIVPIKFLPHYNSNYGTDDPYRGPVDWDKGLSELQKYGDTNLPVHALGEGEFVVVEL